MKPLALLCAISLFAGCVHHAKVLTAPDSTALQAKAHQLAEAVVKARGAVLMSSAAVKDAKTSHLVEEGKISDLVPKVDYIFSIAPQELKPLVADVQLEISGLREAQMLTTAKLDGALAAQGVATARLDEATAAKNEVATLSDAYFAEVEKVTLRANAAEKGWAVDSKSLQWYRLHWWSSWLVLAAGLVAGGILAFLRLINRAR